MRHKFESCLQFSFFENEEALPNTVREYRAEYRRISNILETVPETIDIVHSDLKTLGKSDGGRASLFSSESLFRALLVKQKEGIDYRDACIRISESEFLKDFCKFSGKNGIDYSLICKAFKAISPDSWQVINRLLSLNSIENSTLDVSCIRCDSTVVESNIHWPTDSSLLWDTYRVIARILANMRANDVTLFSFRFHIKKIKSLHLFVTRYASSRSKKRQKQVNKKMIKLIRMVEQALENAKKYLQSSATSIANIRLESELKMFIPSMEVAISCAARRWITGEKVPVRDKIFSIFEPHTELIQRGRREKPIEFGHKIVISQSKGKFITGYQVLENKIDDRELLESVIEQHEEYFGCKPKALAADMGFCPDSDTLSELCDEIDFLEIPQRSSDYSDSFLASAQYFRAGIEGSISCLKRGFRLSRCFFKGFSSFSSAVGSAVFCHNLTVLGRVT